MQREQNLLEDALLAVKQSRLKVADVIQAGLKPNFKKWLENELKKIELNPAFHPKGKFTIENQQFSNSNLFSSLILEKVRKKFIRRIRGIKGTVGVSWGVKYRNDLASERQVLVVWVHKKIKVNNLDQKNKIPSFFNTTIDGRKLAFATDVQQLGKAEYNSGQEFRAGSRAKVSVGANVGTLSGVVRSGNDNVAILSGHVAISRGLEVNAKMPDNSTLYLGVISDVFYNPIVDPTQDCACIRGLSTDYANAISSDPTIIRNLDPLDLHIGLRILCANNTPESSVDAIDVPADFNDSARMSGLIRLSECVTDRGDSGAPVVDSLGQVVGFVVGAMKPNSLNRRGYTYVLPASRALSVI